MQNEKLTELELKIILLTAQGYENNEIAQKLYISHHTVKAHLSKIYNKLKATDRTNAVYLASKIGII